MQAGWGALLTPTTEDGVYIFYSIGTAAYLTVAFAIQFCFRRNFGSGGSSLPRIFDGITFASSILVIEGIFMPDVLKALGSVKLYLVVAGFGGILYCLHALAPRD